MAVHIGPTESAHHAGLESPHHARDNAPSAGCFPDCEATPTNTPTYHDPCRVQDITLSGTKTYNDVGTYHEWFWAVVYFMTFEFQLSIRCDKATGEVAALLNDTGSDPYWGGNDSIWPNFKVITGLVTCVSGNLSGQFTLDDLSGTFCAGLSIDVDMN